MLSSVEHEKSFITSGPGPDEMSYGVSALIGVHMVSSLRFKVAKNTLI